MNEVVRLQRTAGPAVLRKIERLQAAADASMHDSPAWRERAQFVRDFIDDPARVEAETEIEETQARLAAERRRLEEMDQGPAGQRLH